VTAVTISGVPVAPTVGQSVQLSATATLPDGSRLHATTQAAWQSSAAGIANVTATGLLTIVTAGEVDVSATLQGVRGTAHLSIGPVKRGFDISGVVHESAPTENVLLPGATVGIHFAGCPTCPHEGQETIADDQGRFTLPGIETAGFTLWARRPGYDPMPFNIAMLPRDQHPSIGLVPSGYTILDFQGDDQCTLPGSSGSISGWRDVGPFAVHSDGVIAYLGAPTPGRIHFSDGNTDNVLKIESDGHRTPMPFAHSAPPPGVCDPWGCILGGFAVQGGYQYYLEFAGDFEHCGRRYRETWVAPR
jgi:hypothetical protein